MERKHETKISYLIDNEDGAEEYTLDLAKLSDEELAGYVFTVPQAMDELIYRSLFESTEEKD